MDTSGFLQRRPGAPRCVWLPRGERNESCIGLVTENTDNLKQVDVKRAEGVV